MPGGGGGHHPNHALLSSTVTPNKSRGKEAENRVISTAPWLFWGGMGSLGLQESRLQQHSSQRHQMTHQPVHPSHTWATPPSLD